MNSTKYPTDLSDKQWQIIKPYFRRKSNRGRPIRYSRRWVVNAILYLTRSGCQWRLLPGDFPPWRTVYQLFYRWMNSGLWKRIHDALRRKTRKATGRRPTPSAAIIDSQTVKTTDVGGEEIGYDAGKKLKGRKRHLVVDTLGLVLAVVVHAADQQDQDGAVSLLHSLWERMKRIKVIFADSAYKRNGLPAQVRATLGYLIEIVTRREGAIGFEVIRKRWIVERTFAWIGRSRRHSKDYERNAETSVALMHISMIHLMLKRLERLNY